MKLYWRYKKDGKWTWKPVTRDFNYLKYDLDELEFKEEEE
jgi:hypothetical protein